MAVVPGRVTEPGITNTPTPVQGRPVNEFLPNGGASIVVLGPGDTGTGGSWVTVFPLRIGLVVLPLRNGLLVFCASTAVGVAVRTRTLRPIRSIRFTAMSALPVAPNRGEEIIAVVWTVRKITICHLAASRRPVASRRVPINHQHESQTARSSFCCGCLFSRCCIPEGNILEGIIRALPAAANCKALPRCIGPDGDMVVLDGSLS